ncbi:hypothetical protein N7492_000492 [Penicillium capsulatum]|uniref:Uncharacterized protein n=1 Tax=Penicillium capsulatum TaxID=69766 RepID=A0A9W9LYK9_9EURO|nr:hypothetical protein N7492_000492 [Penicillium capsulatum]
MTGVELGAGSGADQADSQAHLLFILDAFKPKMSWQQVSPTRYERDFDSLERFYRVIADLGAPLNKEHYLLSCVVRLKALPPPEKVQQAWKALRHLYPQVAAVANEDGTRFVYTVPSPEDVERWANETFLVEPSESTANDLYSKLPPSPVFKLYYLPGTRELLFRTPHWRIDGIGMLYFQNAFLRILANGPPASIIFDGSEATRLTPSLDEAASVPAQVTPAINDAADAELSAVSTGSAPVSIATEPNALPTTTRRIITSFSPETSQRIIASCKARGITVTTAAHAALVTAMLPHAQHNFDPSTRGRGGGRYMGFNAIDLRKYLPAPWNGPDAAVSIYHTGIPCSVELDDHHDFNSLTTTLGERYKRNLAREEPRNLFLFLGEYVRKVLGLLGAAPENPLHAPAHAELSSFGVIDDYISEAYGDAPDGDARFEVEHWWVAVEVINRLLLANVWTWRGK